MGETGRKFGDAKLQEHRTEMESTTKRGFEVILGVGAKIFG